MQEHSESHKDRVELGRPAPEVRPSDAVGNPSPLLSSSRRRRVQHLKKESAQSRVAHESKIQAPASNFARLLEQIKKIHTLMTNLTTKETRKLVNM